MKTLIPFLLCLAIASCANSRVDGPTSTWERTTTTAFPDGKIETVRLLVQSGGVRITGQAVGEVSIPESSASETGAATGQGELKSKKEAGVKLQPLIFIGAAFIAAGFALGWLAKNVRLGLLVGTAGVTLIGTAILFDRYPWVVLIAAAAGLGALGYIAWRLYQGRETEADAKVMAGAVEDLKKLKMADSTLAAIEARSEAANRKETFKARLRRLRARMGEV